jgi:phosphohistidine phosphatase SixA
MWWFMRHGSAGPTTDAKDDDKRPLDAEGVKQATAAGIALKRLKTPLQHCITSPLARARQTAELACKELGLEFHIDPILAGQPISVLELRRLTKPYGNCLLVGHAPGVSLMVYNLTGAQCQLAKGGLAQVHEGEVWTLLNPSTCMVMAGELDAFADPQDVDHRSLDDDYLVSSSGMLVPGLQQPPPSWRGWKL